MRPRRIKLSSRSSPSYLESECAVIGGGLAGCTAALELAEAGHKVHLFVKGSIERESNSYLIAGGLASVPLIQGKPLSGDSFQLHVRETLAAGKGLNDVGVVRECVKRFFPDVIEWLMQKGVSFDPSQKGYPFHLHREGGHSRNRIFHVKDKTGISIMASLTGRVLDHPGITLHEEHVAIDLITRKKLVQLRKGSLSLRQPAEDACLGLYVYDVRNDRVLTVASKGVFLATGGLGKVFRYTTNADVSTGDGFAMCHRAGLELANMEFVQFHPSVFYDESAAREKERRFLLTEALRGAGAIIKLRRDDDEDLILKYDPLGSNATRDVVARAQDVEMRKHGLKHLWLDCTRISRKRILSEFHSSYEYCMQRGFDMTLEPIPIVYAVHYSNGGVLVGLHGETSIPGCYVLGETACSGLHGATRLASNSGPECVLLSRYAARHFSEHAGHGPKGVKVPLWDVGRTSSARDKTTVTYYWDAVRYTMTALCGVSRHAQRLSAARDVLRAVRKGIHGFYWSYRVNKDFLEVRNIADVALLIVESALAREESRASHYREDFPKSNDRKFRKLSVVKPSQGVKFRSPSR
jgi:L-aspartate oxidase